VVVVVVVLVVVVVDATVVGLEGEVVVEIVLDGVAVLGGDDPALSSGAVGGLASSAPLEQLESTSTGSVAATSRASTGPRVRRCPSRMSSSATEMSGRNLQTYVLYLLHLSYWCATMLRMGTATTATGESPDATVVQLPDTRTRVRDLDHRINALAGILNTQHARLVEVAVELLADDRLWSGWGIRSVQHFLTWKLGLSDTHARQIVTIAERVPDLPDCVTAFRAGRLSLDQMAAIASRAPWWADTEICQMATLMTVRQIRHVVGNYPFPDIPNPDHPDPEPANTTTDIASDQPTEMASPVGADDQPGGDEPGTASGRPEWCSFGFDDEGRFSLHVSADIDTGKLIEAALVEARDHLFQHGVTDVTWIAALRELADRSLDTITEPNRRDRYRIHLHIDTTDGSSAPTPSGWNLPDALRQHLTCDGLCTPVIEIDGIPVSVGRSQRIVPDRTRHLVLDRDGGCVVPGCSATHFLEIHHIVHWEDRGPTDTWNLVALCPHHHRLHHRGELGITGNADPPGGLTFTNQYGVPIPQSGARPSPPGAPPPQPQIPYQHPLGERFDATYVHFNTPDWHRQQRAG
jgi:hypothetical protein